MEQTGRDCPKNFHIRRDWDKTSSKILYETESLATFSLDTETRPRLSSFTAEIYQARLRYLLLWMETTTYTITLKKMNLVFLVWGPSKFGSKIVGSNEIWLKYSFVYKIFVPKKCMSTYILGQKKFQGQTYFW